MKATVRWIREFVPGFDGTPEELCRLLTFSGTEIEDLRAEGDDWVLEAAVTSNRPDCLGVLGLARELSAVTGLPLHPPAADVTLAQPLTEARASVCVEDFAGCPRYTAHVIEGVRPGPSPEWLASRLRAVGVRPVNSVVDVTNYVLLELSQPLHAFDVGKLGGRRIVVRRSRAGESLTAINQREYALPAGTLVIADAERPVAVAGVMGGLRTEVSAGTTDILLESAVFDPPAVRRAARDLGLATEASFRFERGVDPDGVATAARRAARLIVEIAGGTVRARPVDLPGDAGTEVLRRPIVLRSFAVERHTGVAVPPDRAREILERLGCVVVPRGSELLVSAPGFRRDLEREIDLVEEIIRITGFHGIPAEPRMPIRAVAESREAIVRTRIQDRLVACGLFETQTTTFVAPGPPAEVSFQGPSRPLTVRNPVRADESALRQSLLPSLLAVKRANQDHGVPAVRIFELATVFPGGTGEALPAGVPILGLLMDGDLRDLRGVVDCVLGSLGFRACWVPRDLPDLDPGLALEILFDGVRAGVAGRPAEAHVRRFDLRETPWYAEISLEPVIGHAVLTRRFVPLPRFPAMERDLAVVLSRSVSWALVEGVIRAAASPLLAEISFLDAYTGRQIPEGMRSLALRLTFRHAERTLTRGEVDADQERIVAALHREHGATLRA